MIEDELTLAVVLEVSRRGRDEPLVLPERQVVRDPPRAAADAACALERVEEGPFEKGSLIHAFEAVPVGLGDFTDGAVDSKIDEHSIWLEVRARSARHAPTLASG
jgi:hypothetical protein